MLPQTLLKIEALKLAFQPLALYSLLPLQAYMPDIRINSVLL